MMIGINSLADNYKEWIPYVFAHEYHHCVWRNYWYVIKGGGYNTLLEWLLGDGQADSFAKSFNPSLSPKWLSFMPVDKEMELWNKHYFSRLDSTDEDYEKYMFGDNKAGIPWCAGYYFGNRIIECFKNNNPEITPKQLIEMSPDEIYQMSGYGIINK